MRLVEGVLREVHHLAEYRLRCFGGHAPLHRAGNTAGLVAVDEDAAFVFHHVFLLFAHRAAHQIAAAQRVARKVAHDLHHLFLIDHTAVRLLEDAL
ncbi:hypothetical protein SDC9_203359 [bioreactor metagenome]|uniref:Uncharacterized protein n=1 Tax=bioreactor metagenome TaxID=1076179 RepID=A0A645IW78_9ZZZZ